MTDTPDAPIYVVESVGRYDSTTKDRLYDRETAIDVAEALAEKRAEGRDDEVERTGRTSVHAEFRVGNRRFVVFERDPTTVSANVDVEVDE